MREYEQDKLSLLHDFPNLTTPSSVPVPKYPLLENEFSTPAHQNFCVYHNTRYIIKPKSDEKNYSLFQTVNKYFRASKESVQTF